MIRIRIRKIIICSLLLSCTLLAGCKNDRLAENLGRIGKGLNPFNDSKYDSLPEKWQNEYVSDSSAANEAIKSLFDAAENGDKDAFAKNFTEELRSSPGFSDAVDKFFASYPEGLGKSDYKIHAPSGSGSYNYGHNILDGSTYTELTFEGEWYHIGLAFCYENTDNPERVGVTHFNIMDLESRAVYLVEYNKDPDGTENDYLSCRITGSDEVCARLINERPVIWTSTDTPKLTENEMRKVLMANRNDLGNAMKTIGEPNATFKMYNATGYDSYYELKSNDGKPLYAHICSSSPDGRIIDAYVCTEDKQLYDDPLVPWVKPTKP